MQTASHKLAEALYQQQGASGGGEQASAAGAASGGSSPGTQGGEDNVIDAEYVDVDDKK